MRRARRVRRERRHASSSSSDEAGIGVPHYDGFDRDEPPSPEALAGRGVAGARRARAVRSGRAARAPSSGSRSTDWLDRHAAIFAELVGQEAGCAQVALHAAPSVAAWNDACVRSPWASEAPMPPSGRTSMRAVMRAPYPWRRRIQPTLAPSRCPTDA